MPEISLKINAARVCDAIARIGYEPHSALMDIIDNAVAAGARNIRVIVKLIPDKTINQRNNVEKYTIIDDGCGMDEDGIQDAFRLGSRAEYPSGSLSKYGLGLKSAGFSLGTRIQVVSRKAHSTSDRYYLDRQLIEKRQDYVICAEALSQDESIAYEELLGATPSGTVVEILGCHSIYHASAKSTIHKLKRQLGVTYYPFLVSESEKTPLSIVLCLPGGEEFTVEPFDILFTKDALPSFDPSTYDGSAPCFAFKEEWSIRPHDGAAPPPLKLEVITFPKDKMGKAISPLDNEKKRQVRDYQVSRENMGFFIYRNDRLIRWGDTLDGIINKDDIGLRARLQLTNEHDDLLHVDVSKQRLEMDDETRAELQMLLRQPKKQASEIFHHCESLCKKHDEEGLGFQTTADVVPEDDPTEEISPPDTQERRTRKRKKQLESKAMLDQLKSSSDEEKEEHAEPDEEDEVSFNAVRYADNLPSMDAWRAYKDPTYGTFVVINRRHAFYQTVLSALDDSSAERLALEAIIWCCAIGETRTFENLTSVKAEEIDLVFKKFSTILSYNLSEWAGGNQHLFL